MNCTHCSKWVAEGDKFCSSCGQPVAISIKCPTCNAICDLSSAFCGKCGTKLTAISDVSAVKPPVTIEAPPTSDSPRATVKTDKKLEPLRKHVTVLFADVKGSTMLVNNLDPEDARHVLAPVLNEMLQAVYNYNGTVIHTLGDGIVTVFGAPESQEDHALRGCLAALSMQEHVKAIADNISIRVGLHSGEIFLEVVGDEQHKEYDISGKNVNLAARMEQTAKPGTIQMTKDTCELVEHHIKAEALGSIEVKGFTQPIAVFELKEVKALFETKQRPIYLPFLGREKELADLQELLTQVKEGQGYATGIMGEAGQGKSRLLHELKQSSAASAYQIITTGGFSYMSNTPLFPIVQALKALLVIGEGSVTVDRLTVLQDITSPYVVPVVLELLGGVSDDTAWVQMDTQLKRKYRLQSVVDIWLHFAKKHPIFLIIEDLHWVDSETEVLLDLLLAQIRLASLFVLTTYRPEYHDHWTHAPNYMQMLLQPLTKTSEAAALDVLLGTDTSLTSIKSKLLETCAGNPFFLEEMVKSLINEKVVIGTPQHYQLNAAATADKLILPESIFAVLQAEIDNLPEAQKQTLRVASVIGEQFTYSILSKLIEMNMKELREILRALSKKEQEYIYELRLYPEMELAFKHALIQEVTYNSLLKNLRQVLHLKVLTLLETTSLEDNINNLQLKAQHAYLAAAWHKAFTYSEQAATQLFAMGSQKLAASLYEKALDAAQSLTGEAATMEKCFHIHVTLSAIYRRMAQSQDDKKHIDLAKEIAIKLENSNFVIGTRIIEVLYDMMLLDSKKIKKTMQQLLAEPLPDADNIISIKTLSIYVNFILGYYPLVYQNAQDILSQINVEYKGKWTKMSVYGFATIHDTWARAYTGTAVAIDDMVVSLLKIINTHQINLDALYTLHSIAFLYFYKGRFEEAIDYLQRSLKYATDLDMKVYIPWLNAALACTYFRLNDPEKGSRYLHQSIDSIQHISALSIRLCAFDLIVEGLVLANDYEKAVTFLEEALKLSAQGETLGFDTSLKRTAAEIRLLSPSVKNMPEIKQQLEQAMQSAEQLGMPAHAAHCHRLLAKWHDEIGDKAASLSEWRLACDMYDKLAMPYWVKVCQQALNLGHPN